jgi:putative ATP-dependent endonuclease of the OLD family
MLDIWDAYASVSGQQVLTAEQRAEYNASDFNWFSESGKQWGIFLNDKTFEVSIANTPALLDTLLDILSEQGFGSIRTKRIADWRSGTPVDPAQLLAMIADIGKGRLSAKFARKLPTGPHPPAYIAAAIKFVADRV